MSLHLTEMVAALDADIDRLLASQVKDRQSPVYGGFLLPGDHVEPRMSGFGLSRMVMGYVCQESRHHLSTQVKEGLEATLAYMDAHQRPDGCFDLSSCNFASPPDTAFMLNAMLNGWWLLEKRARQETKWLREPMYRLIDTCASGIAAGGFHTPNHRWAIASCLLHVAKITGRTSLAGRARQYLAEGLDINADGEFAERSAGNYNQVNDDQMIRLYLATEDPAFLDAAKANLEMMYCYIDPDSSVFTNNSTRQDYGRKVYLESYFDLFLLVGYFTKDAKLGAMAEWIYRASRAKGRMPGGVEWLLLYPEMDGFGAEEPFPLPFLKYNRYFKDSRIARVRDGDISLTVMEDRANFLYIQYKTFTLYLVIYANICDQRNFVAQQIEAIPGGYRLRSHAAGWYYLPYLEKPLTSDWWAMDNNATRERVQGLPLDTAVEAVLRPDGVDVRVVTEGIDRLPFRLEIGVPANSALRADQFYLSGKAGECVTLRSGSVDVIGEGGEIVTISPAFAAHNVLARMGGAYPQSQEHFTLYMTDYTPVDRTLHIRATGLAPTFPR